MNFSVIIFYDFATGAEYQPGTLKLSTFVLAHQFPSTSVYVYFDRGQGSGDNDVERHFFVRPLKTVFPFIIVT